jgi:hypothetical protein
MVKHTIIGVVGPKRSGKDTVASILVRSNRFIVCPFASFLKDSCKAIFMLSDDQLHGNHKESMDPRWNTTPRKILQSVGDLFRKKLSEFLPELNMGNSETIWCRCFEIWLSQFSTPQCIVIPDVRFHDEANLIKSLGGILLRVNRPGLEDTDDHESEQQQKGIEVEHTIENDGTTTDLRTRVLSWYKTMSEGEVENKRKSLSTSEEELRLSPKRVKLDADTD